MGVPITLTPLPAPDSGCPYLLLAPPLLALGYPALPPGLTDQPPPRAPPGLRPVSQGERGHGRHSLPGVWLLPTADSGNHSMLQSVRPLGPHTRPLLREWGAGHPEAGCPPTLRPHFPGACPNSNHNILWGLACRAGRMTPK